MNCDLHTHSTYSDGTATPTEIIKAADAAGLYAVALTDHNFVSGLPEFTEAAKGARVRAIGGVEFSTDYETDGEVIELHIVALFVEPEYYDAVREFVKELGEEKTAANIELAKSLSAAGYNVSFETMKRRFGNNINRAHFAQCLVELGAANTIQEAFDGMLSKSSGFYKQPKRLDVFKTIRFIKEIGAVSVLAHPYLNLSEEQLDAFLTHAVPAGLSAMETRYSDYDNDTERRAIAMAKKHGICESGGSDYHGARKPHIKLGTGRGDLRVPSELLDILETKIKR